jgi:hypothetical protein
MIRIKSAIDAPDFILIMGLIQIPLLVCYMLVISFLGGQDDNTGLLIILFS